MSGAAWFARGLLIPLLLPFIMALPAHALTLKGGVNQSVSTPEPQTDEPGIVGVNLNVYHNRPPKIVEVYPGTPAAKVQLEAGDEILAVDDHSTEGLSKDELDDAISDVPGQTVHFLIRRHQKVMTVSLVVMAMSQLRSQPIAHLYQSVFGD